jgi:HK97 family phage major capsid protein
LPRGLTSATSYWLPTEATAVTESTGTIGQLAMTPKTVGCCTEFGGQLDLQSSPAIEAVLMAELAADLAVAVDIGAINRSGSVGQPFGILQTSNIGTFSGTSLTYDLLLEPQSHIPTANAMINPATCGYATTVAVAKLLANRQRFTGTDAALWQGNLAEGQIAGFPAMSSASVPAGTMIFGDWSQLMIGEWGVLELMTDPFTNFKSRIVGLRALWTIDIAVRAEKLFSVATSVS